MLAVATVNTNEVASKVTKLGSPELVTSLAV